ncbi:MULTISPECIES: flagellar hook-associated protein FlgL [unclassified Methylophilus]|jgi:flagellar hook-associated protein 3 FlgL|uniref:flagellar hook-associated protein FlgL n=1 Tax=unclassified Methylophilus TaxID=2630143 RepID=UPI00188EB63B|nr:MULTISPECIES: flagellar hook-associated protein FlgL [unclassified Methylophilus]MBF5038142.1 flagellar hook-associated protein FlgL [Methylophilus sp. 13]MDF0376668.1 flagellar hook-associated protein 3 [Methylophilus sp. YYY-1]MDT7850566.1 flagellar hook-associated protein FlgL [Methylophilus sp. VKM B-3414]BEV07891.1 flagellar hook-associated protein FlgL [Methylophilus sp. DW102]
MRLSTNTIYANGTNRLMGLQSDVNDLNEKISSGKKVRSPADDPVASARIIEINNNKSMKDTFAETRKTASSMLENYETNLSSVTDLVLNIKSSLTAAGNATYNDSQRQSIATELQGRLDSLISLANAKDSMGNFIYSGFTTDKAAFTSAGVFQGETSRMNLQIDDNRTMPTTFTGDSVFNANGNNLFANMQQAITLLNTPITDATSRTNFTNGLATALQNTDKSLDSILDTRAQIGSQLNEIQILDDTGDDISLQYSKVLSDLQDLDYTQALSDLAKKNTIMEAAQKSFVSTSKLSLFQFI